MRVVTAKNLDEPTPRTLTEHHQLVAAARAKAADTAKATAEPFQALPPLSAEDYRALEESILSDGVLCPILVDENGVVIDGHHRQKIAKRHNVPCPREVKAGFTDVEKRTMALTLNLHRRHIIREQRRELVAESIKADPQLSDREHGRRTGVSDKTVGTVRRELESTAEIPQSETRVSGDGRSRPASNPRRRSPKLERRQAWAAEQAKPPCAPTESTPEQTPRSDEALNPPARSTVPEAGEGKDHAGLQPGLDGNFYPPARTKNVKPPPLNEFVAQYGAAATKLQAAMLELQKLGKHKDFAANRHAVIHEYRDGIVWVQDTGRVLLAEDLSNTNPTA